MPWCVPLMLIPGSLDTNMNCSSPTGRYYSSSPTLEQLSLQKIWDKKWHSTAVNVCLINMLPLFYFGRSPSVEAREWNLGKLYPYSSSISCSRHQRRETKWLKRRWCHHKRVFSTPVAQWSEPQGYCRWSANFIDHDISFPLLRTIWGVLCFHQNAPRPDWWNCYTSRLRSLRFTPRVL